MLIDGLEHIAVLQLSLLGRFVGYKCKQACKNQPCPYIFINFSSNKVIPLYKILHMKNFSIFIVLTGLYSLGHLGYH